MLNVQIDTTAFDYPDIAVPPVWTVRQIMEAPVLADIEGNARAAARALFSDPRLHTGATVAVGVGSRGIANIATIVRAVVAELIAGGCKPFIVPAMGSHGGATVEGQTEILANYGITLEGVGAPIRATMETEQVASLDDGYPVYFDKNALGADAVVVVNRVKHHTDFTGEIESGVGKMCAIGLGKRKGADSIHRFGADGLRHVMPKVARKLIDTLPIVGGIAIIENPFAQTAEIHHVPAVGMASDIEKGLLKRARALAPRLPFDALDVLVVDRLGKNISGSGMDTHVIGRVRMPSIDENEWDGPNVRMVVTLDLTDETHGNGAGIGLADVVTRRLVERLSFAYTATNHRTSGEGGAHRQTIPIVAEDAAMAIRIGMGMCGRGRIDTIRLARIRDTEFVEVLEVNEPVYREVSERTDFEVLSGPHPMDLCEPLSGSR